MNKNLKNVWFTKKILIRFGLRMIILIYKNILFFYMCNINFVANIFIVRRGKKILNNIDSVGLNPVLS